MDKWIAYICGSCRTFNKVKPNLMKLINKCGFLIFLLLTTASSIVMAQPCDSPENVYVETIAFNAINVSWDEVENASYYEVEYGSVEDSNSETIASNTNSITISELEAGTYEVEVITYCVDGSTTVSFAIIHIVVDNLEDIENMCYTCYQKFKSCEAENGYENCDCQVLCDGDTDCCDFVNNNVILITPPSFQACDCKTLCEKKGCCDYIIDDTGAMPISCQECAEAVRECNNSTKIKSNKTTIPLIEKEACRIETIHPNPFREELKVAFELEHEVNTILKVYSASGYLISEILNDGKQEKGKYEYHLNSNDWQPGVYYSILETNDGCKSIQKVLKIE